jgi:hypothetical protein
MGSGTPYGFIYLVRNKVNGKVYVGQTTRSRGRWSQHNTDPQYDASLPLHLAIRKYGGRHQAASALEHLAEGGSGGNSLGLSIDGTKPHFGVLGQEWILLTNSQRVSASYRKPRFQGLA